LAIRQQTDPAPSLAWPVMRSAADPLTPPRYPRSMPAARRFPPPWIVEGHNNACFIVKDTTGQALGYFYFDDEPQTGCLHSKVTPAARWSCRFSPTPGGSATKEMPSCDKAMLRPTRESIKICGEPVAPAHRIISSCLRFHDAPAASDGALNASMRVSLFSRIACPGAR
jgi:hypothetical protein